MSQNDTIEWTAEIVSVKKLEAFERNPRKITEAQYRKLRESLEQDGYHSRIKVTKDFRVIGGHQRLRVMKDMGIKEISVLVPNRQLSDEEFKRILLRDNHNNGTYDMDMLSCDFDLEYLREVGLHEVNNIAPEFDGNDIEENLRGERAALCPHCGETFPVKGNTVNDG